MKVNKKYVVVGAGIAGLISALKLIDKGIEGQDILIIDKESEPGGLLRSWASVGNGNFDIGTHILAETGNDVVDGLLAPFYSGEKWQKLEGNAKDLPGCFYNNTFHDENQFIPFSSIDSTLSEKYTQGILNKLESNHNSSQADVSAYDFYSKKYNDDYIEEVIEPIYRKTFGKESKHLSAFVCHLLPLNRVISDNSKINESLLSDEKLRSVFGFPIQKEVPALFVSKTASYYPKERGVGIFVEAITEYLWQKKVSIETEANILALKIKNSTIESITYQKNNQTVMVHFEKLIWSAGMLPLCKMLGVPVDFSSMDKPLNTVVAQIVFHNTIELKSSHYYYILDTKYKTYRITNYNAFCPPAKNLNGTPLTFEFIIDALPENLLSLIQKEINDLGLAKSEHDFEILDIKVLSSGFPILSLNNEATFDLIREKLKELAINNLINVGVLSEKGLFFYRDILKDVNQKLS
jgi:protoporphyrinogen oxidase